MKFTVREIFGIFLLLIVLLLSLGAWRSFFETVLATGAGDIWQPILWFSAVSAFFFAGAVAWERKSFRFLGPMAVFLPSLIFIPSWQHAVFEGLAILSAVWSIAAIRSETHERLRFHFFKSSSAGKFALVLALSLSISSGYFALVKDASWQELVPRFRLGEGMSTLLLQTVAAVRPDLRELSDENMTVDGFLAGLKRDQEDAAGEESGNMDELLSAIPGASEYVAKNGLKKPGMTGAELAGEVYLRSGREQLSALAGRPVMGDEKISAVFSSAIEQKITGLFGGGEAARRVPSQAIPFFLALLLFLTLLPLGSILGPVWILLSLFIFSLSLRFRWLKIARVEKEQEILEE